MERLLQGLASINRVNYNSNQELKRSCLHNVIVIMVSGNTVTLQLVILSQGTVRTGCDLYTLDSRHVALFTLIQKRIVQECTHLASPAFVDILADEIR